MSTQTNTRCDGCATSLPPFITRGGDHPSYLHVKIRDVYPSEALTEVEQHLDFCNHSCAARYFRRLVLMEKRRIEAAA